jgi:carboxylesterase
MKILKLSNNPPLISSLPLRFVQGFSSLKTFLDSRAALFRGIRLGGLPLIEDLSIYGNEFTLGNGPKACLLIHGLGCGPIQMKELGERLALSGFTARGILLPGHCEDTEALGAAQWQDWYDKVEKEYLNLRQRFEHVSVVGFSIGGLLALKLSSHHPVDRVVSLGAPIFVISEHFPFTKLLRVTERLFTKIKTFRKKWPIRSEELEGILKFPTVPYYPITTIKTLGDLIRITKMSLDDIHSPLLVVHSRKDFVSAPFSAFYIFHYVRSREKRLVWLRRSHHLMMFDREKSLLFKTVRSFLKSGDGEPAQTVSSGAVSPLS